MKPVILSSAQIHPHGWNGTDAVIYAETANDENASPLIVACPHAGIGTPPELKDQIIVTMAEFLSRGDRFTDLISVSAPHHGAAHIICTTAASYLNVGRASDSIHPDDVRGGPGTLKCDPNSIYVNKRQGQGLVALKTLIGDKPIYKPEYVPDAHEIQRRIDTSYAPFHNAMQTAVERRLEKFSIALIFDVHSCPHIGPPCDNDAGQPRPDMILSDAFGASCDPRFMEIAETIGKEHGFNVVTTHPAYKGGYNTRHYGKTGPFGARSAQALQVEWNRTTALGVNEDTLEIENFNKFIRAKACQNAIMETLATAALEKN